MYFGVLQGSILDPVLFNLHVADSNTYQIKYNEKPVNVYSAQNFLEYTSMKTSAGKTMWIM